MEESQRDQLEIVCVKLVEAAKQFLRTVVEVWKTIKEHVLEVYKETEHKEERLMKWDKPKRENRIKHQVLNRKPRWVFARTNC